MAEKGSNELQVNAKSTNPLNNFEIKRHLIRHLTPLTSVWIERVRQNRLQPNFFRSVKICSISSAVLFDYMSNSASKLENNWLNTNNITH